MKIEIIRGTSNTIYLTLKNSQGQYRTLSANEKILFGVKQTADDVNYIVRKEITSAEYDSSTHKYAISLLPSDTRSAPFGIMHYDIGLLSQGNYYNIVPYAEFVINKNITSGG